MSMLTHSVTSLIKIILNRKGLNLNATYVHIKKTG